MGIDRPEDALAIGQVYEKAESCLLAVKDIEGYSDKYHVSTDIESIVVNTWSRSRSYIKYNAKFSGMIFDMIVPDLKNCEFDTKK